ncbi:hypothetical protein A2368_01155 [Candidatus Collierbacteria bacterium RIFOXYB1_FULL_49_13]|uniref:HTH cro/C1-type domain-containing protein n=1 Tax=Candidatus Collierbacteria bacterium RIFOXYB1_FULL_49_13 TaxID=1817728 RepID=A0A1F5FG53_9BACT|nr:MAG: hypothetical protein A2368_01155 [Candidatus Collierbacteria bacterium RIFOXYB1_FULL_49_13]
MKTIGEILREARTEKRLTLEEVSRFTRIEIKYLKALEDNHFDLLPPTTFTKGFIRNYAKAVGKSPDDLIAIYRRDYDGSHKTHAPSADSLLPVKPGLLHSIPISRATILGLIAFVFVFTGYLAFQYRALITPPPLTITKPAASSVVTSPVTIQGKTTPDCIVQINDDTNVNPDQSGIFTTQLPYSPGAHSLTITAINRFGKKATTKLDITVISQN